MSYMAFRCSHLPCMSQTSCLCRVTQRKRKAGVEVKAIISVTVISVNKIKMQTEMDS